MKQNIQSTLESLIQSTYKVEQEYKILSASYDNMRNFVRQIVESLGAALWVVDSNGKIVLENSLASTNGDVFASIKANDKSQEIELNGKYYAVKITKSGDHSVILATDISAEKRSARLVSMGAMAAHLSHEIRNPIGSIALLTSTLLKRSEPKNIALIQEIQKSLFRVERIIKATLLFTKGVYLNKRDFALSELKIACENAIKCYDFSAQIDFNFIGFDGIITGDFDLLDLVFSNFIFNGIDAIEESEAEHGMLSIEHKFINNEHIFNISDTGVRIDPSVIYEPFKTTKLKGNGLGLALSTQIINAHKGTLDLQNDPKLFTITLP